MKKLGNGKGFTLIELLLVVGILAILAAILFPVFTSARESARKSTCISNLKQLLLATSMYINDSSDKFPPGVTPEKRATWTLTTLADFWPSRLDAYVKSLNPARGLTGIYICPSAPRTAPDRRSYGYNAFYLGWAVTGRDIQSARASQLTAPSSTIVFLENWNFKDNNGSIFCYPPVFPEGGNLTVCSTQWVWPAGWHRNISHVGMADGHVRGFRAVPGGTRDEASNYAGVMDRGPSGGADERSRNPWFRLDGEKP